MGLQTWTWAWASPSSVTASYESDAGDLFIGNSWWYYYNNEWERFSVSMDQTKPWQRVRLSAAQNIQHSSSSSSQSREAAWLCGCSYFILHLRVPFAFQTHFLVWLYQHLWNIFRAKWVSHHVYPEPSVYGQEAGSSVEVLEADFPRKVWLGSRGNDEESLGRGKT